VHSGYKVIKTVPINGEGGWDYVTVDSDARRVYVSHATQVVVLDADTLAVVGSIPDTQRCARHRHRIRPRPRLHQQRPRQQRDHLRSEKLSRTIGTVNTGANPDAIVYDSGTKRVFTLNGRSKDATAINAADGTVVGTFALGGKPNLLSPTAMAASTSTSRTLPNSCNSIRKSSPSRIAGRKSLVRKLPASPST